MAERCQHVVLDSETVCDCPHFVPKVNLTATEVNICDGCLHSIAWHRIPSPTCSVLVTSTSTSTCSTSTASSVYNILASFASQAASSGAKKAQKRGKRVASETKACQEAVSVLKRSLGKGAIQDTSMVSP